MKKVFFSLLLLAVAMFMTTNAFALSGVCSNCHTMHDSQGGASVGGPNSVLLVDDCIACHSTGGTGPNVISTSLPVYPSATYLAGGNFYWVDTGADDAKGHNIDGFVVPNPDGVLVNTPPGAADAMGGQLTCAGTLGCHGDSAIADPDASISGAHHGNVALGAASATGTTSADSYRFLVGVRGIEDVDYEATVSASDHNQYSGNDVVDASTISTLCASCHTDFHGAAGTVSGTTWIRHPTDLDLVAQGGEYTSYATYNPLVPVGSITNTALVNANVQTAGNGIVTCLSCHRAHGSENDDLLRFAYTMNTNSGTNATGCFVCHSSKDGVAGN